MLSQSRSCIPYCYICFSCILFACQENLSLVHEDSSLCSIKSHTVLGTKALREKSSLLHSSLLLLCVNQIVLSILQLTSYHCQTYLEVVLTVCSIFVNSSLLVPNQTSLPQALSLTYLFNVCHSLLSPCSWAVQVFFVWLSQIKSRSLLVDLQSAIPIFCSGNFG